ncbi:MAG: family NAD(P)-dependent oxidoreductase, partial [Deltaproteobacteria bacterium]|nr:family NAD(P)-dependent oxidoreductase [Deltaproteobacteria bacterium]
KIAVVTGGGGILCGAMSKGLAKAGAKVMVLDLLEAAAQKVVEEIRKDGGQAFAFQADALDKKSLERVCEEIVKKFGRVDILINGAGGNKPQATTSPDLSFFDLPQDAFRWVFDLNFTCSLLASQVFGKVMAKQKDGIVLNVSSMNYFRPLTRVPAYSAAKAAVSNFTQWLAVHFSQNYSPKIRVNAIAPGFFLTEQNRFLLTERETGTLTARGKSIIDHTPMSRFGDPEDLVGAVLWLLSPASQFVHGAVIAIDGGFSAFSGV